MAKFILEITYDENDAESEHKDCCDDWTMHASETVEFSFGRLFGGRATAEIRWED
jgi:hypothetical protein